MASGNGDAASTKACSSCLTNRIPVNSSDPLCADCQRAADRLLKDRRDRKDED